MCSSFIPVCVDERKPILGMSFHSIKDVEEFYKSYAHNGGFSVRIGPQNLALDGVINKRFMCSRAGFKKVKETDDAPKNQKNHALSRCGCNANIYVKLGTDKKYYITSMVEEHNHPLCSPDKTLFLRSNHSVSQRAKNTLCTCHKASIGTSQAYRILQVNDGGFNNIGCTKRDLQNYYRGLREKIKDADAQLFVAQLERKKEANAAFFYDFIVDEDGKLLYIFWADGTSRKNYSHFGDLASFDSTYSTNQYNMKFTPFTGVSHHMQSIFFGGGFLINERIESYEWLFKTFLAAMGGKAPVLIITDEDASMKSAIASCFPETVHRFCMWHILEKIPEKAGHAKTNEEDFWHTLNNCVWGSETGDEFETRWNAFIIKYGLESNEWMANRYEIRESWIPAYFRHIPLAGLLRTTSRSESANSFFNRFIHRKLSFVEFWLRFDTALECQRHEELKEDHMSLHTSPLLSTPWLVERQGSILYTRNVFKNFQKEVQAARDHCSIINITQFESMKMVVINDGSLKDRVVRWYTSNTFGNCSCMLFEEMGIPCRHVILTLRCEKLNELPLPYFLKRFETRCKRESVYDEEGNLLDEKSLDADEVDRRKKVATVRNKVEDMIQQAKSSKEGMIFLVSSMMNIEASLSQIVPTMVQTSQQEYEGFIGCEIPKEVYIHPPNDVRSKGRSKRIKKSKELSKPRKRKST